MNTAYISALAGLTGAGIGGLTSFASSWLTLHTQLTYQYREAERKRRETLFNAFIAEASRLYGDALVRGNDDVTQLVKLYALVTRIRLTASPAVLMAAERAMDTIVDTYLKPNKTLHELKLFAEQGGMDFLHDFGEACRAELDGVMRNPFGRTDLNINRREIVTDGQRDRRASSAEASDA